MTPESNNHAPDALIFGDARSPALRHEVPVPFSEPSAYAEHGGRRFVFTGSLEVAAVRALGGFEVIALEELGLNDNLARGLGIAAAAQEAVAEGCRRIGLTAAVTPRDFPLELAELLRERGVSLRSAGHSFDSRRRVKSAIELAGVTRAQRAAEAAMEAIRRRLGNGRPADAAELRMLAREELVARGAVPHEMLIVACGPQGASPHEEGSGPIRPGEPIVVDIFPRDLASGCWGDLTRTLCLGDPPKRLRGYHEDVREAGRRAIAAIRPGVSGDELNSIAAGTLADRGHPTRLGLPSEQLLEEGFVHVTGHGVGLDLIEDPLLDAGTGPLRSGDVVTIEPGVYYEGFGGVRVEDLVLVTDDGHRLLTQCPYGLEVG